MKDGSDDMVTRAIIVRACDVVFLKGIVEAHDGVALVTGESGGAIVLSAPKSLERQLDELVRDLGTELGAIVSR
jgi:hypothetical protein